MMDEVVFEVLEYRSPSNPNKVLIKRGWKYLSVSNGAWPCLELEHAESGTRHYIEIERVIAITISGNRYELVSPPTWLAYRSQEIDVLLHGLPNEPWRPEGSIEIKVSIEKDRSSRAFIKYTDSKNNTTQRVIFPLHATGIMDFDRSQFDISKIDARCETAKSTRTFIVDRIEEVISQDTGEILTPLQWIKQIPFDKSDIQRLVEYRSEIENKFGSRQSYSRIPQIERKIEPSHDINQQFENQIRSDTPISSSGFGKGWVIIFAAFLFIIVAFAFMGI